MHGIGEDEGDGGEGGEEGESEACETEGDLDEEDEMT